MLIYSGKTHQVLEVEDSNFRAQVPIVANQETYRDNQKWNIIYENDKIHFRIELVHDNYDRERMDKVICPEDLPGGMVRPIVLDHKMPYSEDCKLWKLNVVDILDGRIPLYNICWKKDANKVIELADDGKLQLMEASTGKQSQLFHFKYPELASLDLDRFKAEILLRHNYHRKMHGVEDLKMDTELTAEAQKYADLNANTSSFPNDPNLQSDVGESIFFMRGQSFDKCYACGDYLVDIGYDEFKQWDYKGACNKTGNIDDTARFTQIVWKNTTALGVGAVCSGDKIRVVCRYKCAGNVKSEFKENVLYMKK